MCYGDSMNDNIKTGFSTSIIFRCMPKKYANDFIKGKIRFSMPINWVKIEENGNRGQGDILEGVSLATYKQDNSNFIANLKKTSEIDYFEKGNLVYFREKNVLNLYSLCFYALEDSRFKLSTVDRFGKNHYQAKIDKNYFSTFNSVKSKEEYFSLEETERPCVIFIKNPKEFFEKIIRYFEKIGIAKSDVLICPVNYVDYSKPFFNMAVSPTQLFIKDSFFANQCEIRIVINSKSETLNSIMSAQNNIIDIGDLSDIAFIEDNYFDDLIIEKQSNAILYNLPFKKSYDIEDLPMKELIAIYWQTITDRLPEKESEERINLITNIINDVLQKKYGFSLAKKNDKLIAILPNKSEIVIPIKW